MHLIPSGECEGGSWVATGRALRPACTLPVRCLSGPATSGSDEADQPLRMLDFILFYTVYCQLRCAGLPACRILSKVPGADEIGGSWRLAAYLPSTTPAHTQISTPAKHIHAACLSVCASGITNSLPACSMWLCARVLVLCAGQLRSLLGACGPEEVLAAACISCGDNCLRFSHVNVHTRRQET